MRIYIFLLAFFVFFFLLGSSDGRFYQRFPPERIVGELGQEKAKEHQTSLNVINDGRRLTTNDPVEIKWRIDQINSYKGINVVFVGDSVLYGDGTTSEEHIIPYLFRQKLSKTETGQAVNVFNFTLPSAGPAEVYLLTRELVKAKVDLLIYDVNIGWFGRDKVLEHEVLLKLGDNKDLNPAEFRVDNPDEAIPNQYNIYDEDDENIRDLATSWTQKKWEGVLDQYDAGSFGPVDLVGCEQWKYIQDTAVLSKEYNISSLYFANPRNFTLFDRYDLIDYEGYHKTIGEIFSYLEGSGITTLNLDSAVPSDYFSDLVHLLPEGEDIVAGKLSEYVISTGLLAEHTITRKKER